MLETLKLRANLIESSCLISGDRARERGTVWLFHSMHDYCFLPCMWPHVIDLFNSKQVGIAGMAVSFSITRGIAWPEGRSLAWSLPIVFFHACMWPQVIDLFSSKQAEIIGMVVSFSIAWGIAWPEGRNDPKKSRIKNSLTFSLFSCRRLVDELWEVMRWDEER